MKDIPQIRIEPTSAIAAAREHGQISASRVGSTVNSSGKPTIVFETVGPIAYVKDIVPKLSGGRVLSLTAEADKSAALSLTTSYLSSDPSEVTQVPSEDGGETPPAAPATLYERSHSLLVQFGAGDVRHAFEIDCAEGSTCNVPGHHVDVTLLDYSFDRRQDAEMVAGSLPGQDPDRPYKNLRSFASVAAGPNIHSARLTQKVWCPYQVPVDMANPPSVADFIRSLILALQNQTITFT